MAEFLLTTRAASVDAALKTLLAGALRQGCADAALLPQEGRAALVATTPKGVLGADLTLPGKAGLLRDPILRADRGLQYAVVLLPCDVAWLARLRQAGKIGHVGLVLSVLCRGQGLEQCGLCRHDASYGCDIVLTEPWLRPGLNGNIPALANTELGTAVLNGCVDRHVLAAKETEPLVAWHARALRSEQMCRRNGPPVPVGPDGPRKGRKLRVGFITPALYWGGAERWMLDLARMSTDYLDWVGCACAGAMYRDQTMVGLFEPCMPVYSFGREAVRKVAAKADVLLAWGSYDLEGMVYGYTGPVVFVSHGCGQFDQNAVRSCLTGATHFTAVAEAAREPFAPYMPMDAVTVLHNGIDPQRCVPTRPRKAVREELGVSDSHFLVGYLGRVSGEKNPLGVAKAVALLPNKFRALFVGGGADAERQREAIRGVLGKRAIFVDRTEAIGDYYRAMDCFALLSPREGFSMAMLEAVHCGVPCVLTNVGVLPELERMIGRHWETVPFDGETPRHAAKAIAKLAAMPPEKRAKLTERCRTAIGTQFTGEHMVRRWVDYLERIVPAWYSKRRAAHAS